MRVKATILATIMLVSAACNAAAPAPQQSTEADITLSGPVSITLWHALSGPQQVALDAMVKKFNDTNGKGITVTALNQGNYTQLYQKTLGAIQAGALSELAPAYESFARGYEEGRLGQGHAHGLRVQHRRLVLQRAGLCARRKSHGRRQQDGGMERQGRPRRAADVRPHEPERVGLQPEELRLSGRPRDR